MSAGVEVVELPYLPYATVAGETVAGSYLNFYICNGGVIVPVAGADTDAAALEIIARRYPGREVVPVPGLGARLRRRRAALHHPAGTVASRWPTPELITAFPPPPSPARTRPPERAPLRLGLVQERWHADPDEHEAALAAGIRMAAGGGGDDRVPPGADAVAVLRRHPRRARRRRAPRPRTSRPGRRCPSRAAPAAETGVHVHASLYERADADDGLGYNTAIVVAPDGTLVSRTRKLHIPVTAGYYEDHYFRPGPAGRRRRSR